MTTCDPKLLAGVKVICFTHWLQGPACAQYLADMGADVVKVEAPGGGFERKWFAGRRSVGGISTLQIAANRNCRTVAVDLKSGEGHAVAMRLIESADVLVENYRPGVMDRLGLGFDEVKKTNPGIIFASATGYGPDGPMRERPGQDLLVQARSGLISQSWRRGKAPVPLGNSGIDQHGGAVLALGIVGALFRRERTGQGCRVEGSLYSASLDLMQESLTHYFSGGHDPQVFDRHENLSTWYMDAPYGAYGLNDGAIVVSMTDLRTLALALDVPDLAGLDAWNDRDRCAELLSAKLAAMTIETATAVLQQHGIWFERIMGFDDVRDDPLAAHLEVFQEMSVNGQNATVVSHPIRYDRQVASVRHFSANPGQDTRAVLSEAGFSSDEIERMRIAGVITEHDEGGKHGV